MDDVIEVIVAILGPAALIAVASIPVAVGFSIGELKLDTQEEEYREELNGCVSKVANVDNFSAKSFSLKQSDEKYILNMFGEQEVKTEGKTTSKYLNIKFNIDEKFAKEILNAAESFAELNGTRDNYQNVSYNSFKQKQSKSAMEQLYGALNYAINTCYSVSKEYVYEATSTKTAVINCFHQENLAEMHLIGVTSVYEDDESNKSFFYIDTLQKVYTSKDKEHSEWKVTKLRIEVEGVNLPSEDVYAKFICGEYSAIYEVADIKDLDQSTIFDFK